MSRDDRGPDPVGRWLRDLGRAAQWHRRLLSGGLLAGALAVGLHTLAPPAPPSVPALVAAQDLPSGARLDAAHVRVEHLPPDAVPRGALRPAARVTGATLTSAVRRGEVLTDVRVLGAAAVRALPLGQVAVPVRLADAEAVRLLEAGTVVDVLAAGEEVGPARLVASAVRVLAVPRETTAALSGVDATALVVLATTDETAARLAGAAATARLSVVIRG